MITPEQREARRHYIGSSDSSAILGVDPYRSASDVWLEKTGKVDGFAGNANTDRGNLLEPVVLDWAERELDAPLVRDVFIPPSKQMPILGANLDAQIEGNGRLEVVEAKTTVNADEWGTPGTDEIPERVIVQVHHAMLCRGIGCRIAHVPVLIPGFKSFDWRMYQVMRDDQLCAVIVERAEEFWDRYVKADVEPADFRPSLEVLKRVRREPNKVVTVAPELLDQVIVARAAVKQAKEECEGAEAALLAAMADAEAADTDAGQRVTYFTTKRAGYSVQPCEFRSLRFSKRNKQLAAPVAAEMEIGS